ncbi:hypothetical protein KKR94_p00335 (plasmid) [Klebsiella pneumoniae]|nr:hypothetical protein KKR94_p00335 [Klebsiella pneumoniae]
MGRISTFAAAPGKMHDFSTIGAGAPGKVSGFIIGSGARQGGDSHAGSGAPARWA